MEWLVVAIGVANVALQIVQDRRLYPRFKAMTETADRQRTYRMWLIDGVLRYGVLGVVCLFLITRGEALWAFPADIATARDALALQLGFDPAELARFGFIIALAMTFGVVAGGLIPFWIKPQSTEAAVVGNIGALLPRNADEMKLTALMSINAGVSEEIFFRLAMPLALYAISGDLLIAFGLAAALFGIVHAYQGAIGVVLTFIVGAVMTALYLATGQIWLVIALHAIIDLRALVLTPLALKRA